MQVKPKIMQQSVEYIAEKPINGSQIGDGNWDLVVEGKTGLLTLNLKEIWKYKDLLFLFVRRDVVTVYKQTVLGPLWFFIQPLLTTLVFTVIFGSIANISTDGLPHILFYLSGVILWNYFSESFITTSKTFTENAHIFGKVYFPRLIIPLSKVISNLIKLFIQFGLFALIYLYFFLFKTPEFSPSQYLLIIPYLIVLMACLGLGFGLIFSALTTKYRDLSFLIAFGVQLMMYATPVIYPLSSLSGKYKLLILLNPVTPIIETFRYAVFSQGTISFNYILYSSLIIGFVLLVGVLIFNKTEKSFVDTV